MSEDDTTFDVAKKQPDFLNIPRTQIVWVGGLWMKAMMAPGELALNGGVVAAEFAAVGLIRTYQMCVLSEHCARRFFALVDTWAAFYAPPIRYENNVVTGNFPDHRSSAVA